MLEVQEIVEIIEDCLYAVQWKGEKHDSYEKMINDITDHKFLVAYLDENIEYIKSGYYKLTDIERIVGKLQDEFYELLEELNERADKGPLEELETLERLFEPLDGRKSSPNYRKAKLKDHSVRQPILRIYGVKEEPNCIVISGYAIKFTKWMDDHKDTKKEKKKINVLADYLGENGL